MYKKIAFGDNSKVRFSVVRKLFHTFLYHKKWLTPLEKAADFRGLRSLTGLTLLEIIVAAAILSIVTTGLMGIFISGKRWLRHSRFKMAGGELGKYFLDPFATAVRQDQWSGSITDYQNGNLLSIAFPPASGTKTLNGKVYTASYQITTIPGLDAARYPQARKVKVTVSWPEEG